MEREADRVGFSVLSGAGYAPSGMADMFERLAQASRLNDNGAFPYLRSHPLTTERIGEARSRLSMAPAQTVATGATSALMHTLARARARVLMDTRVVALRRWLGDADLAVPTKASDASTLHKTLAVLYERALSASLLRDFNRADAALRAVGGNLRALPTEQAAATQRVFDLLAVQSQLDRGHVAQAVQILQAYANERSRPLTLLRAQVTLALGETSPLKAQADALQTWVALQPQDASAWAVLGQIWSRLQQPLRALRAEAESRHALGDISGAIDRLRQAQRLAHAKPDQASLDSIEMSVVATRLRLWEAQRREQTRSEARTR
jgi:beta-barrel assembly-enhancing protease